MKKESDFKILRRLFSLYAVHNKSTITACIFCAIVTGLRPYIMIVLSGILIDGLIGGMPFSTLMIWLAAGLAVNFAAEALEAWLREAFNAKVENCLERQNRDMNEKSLYSDFENLENPEIQEKKRKQEQVVNVRGGIYWMLIWPMDKGLTGLIIVVTAIIVAAPLFAGGSGSGHPGLIVMSIILAVMIVACSWASYKNSDYWNKKIHKVFDQYAKCNRVSNYILHSILSGSETGKDLRIFGQQELIEEGVLGQQQEALEKLKEIRKQGMTQSGIEATLTTVNCGLIYLYAAFKAYLGLITVGSVVKYASGIIQCINGIKNILFCATGWRQAVDYGREYLEYLEFENSTKDGSGHVSENEDQSILLECEHVSFRYPGTKEDAIHDLNLKMVLKPGDHIAIVGRNGSGKTTFIKLLCRLYNVTEGVIRVNGKDIRDYAYEEYVDIFSVVFQDYRMFSLELGENIAASEKVEEERVLDAMRKAGLGHRLENLPNGLDTYVGKEFEESGVNFSGGERQKLAIARAIYKDAPFVIMDEPTAALDPISECDVYESFDRLVGHKAAVYISHRLASCRFCDKILVFSEGGVVQNGSHEALVEQKGLYREMWNAQAQWYAETAEG
ncbi:MAG: ABC transporter ATP-binding protein [Lachnospiraceae bacterium]|nr:ABC transporter ATP-binding protein [Lachnospiraceae bacterium]